MDAGRIRRWVAAYKAAASAIEGFLLTCIICAVAVALWGCGEDGYAAAGATILEPQTVGDLTATLSVDPYPPPAMGKTEFLVTLTDGRGQLVTGATVSSDMTMPAMPMPPNRPEAVEDSAGVYRVEVLFTMAGDWEAAVEALLADGSTTEFVFAMTAR